MSVRFVCPNECRAGYVVTDGGRNECVECGSPVVRPDQTTLEDA